MKAHPPSVVSVWAPVYVTSHVPFGHLDRPPSSAYPRLMEPAVLWGLFDHQSEEIYLFYDTRDEAQADLNAILADEASWVGLIEVVRIEVVSARVA